MADYFGIPCRTYADWEAEKRLGKSRTVGVWERIFIPDLSPKIKDLGLWYGRKEDGRMLDNQR